MPHATSTRISFICFCDEEEKEVLGLGIVFAVLTLFSFYFCLIISSVANRTDVWMRLTPFNNWKSLLDSFFPPFCQTNG